MAVSKDFQDFVIGQMAGFAPVDARSMFGGVGIFRAGRMFALIADDVLYLKSGPANAAVYDAEDLAPFSYDTRKGDRVVMSYRRAPEAVFDDPDEMARWCEVAWQAARLD